MHLIPELYVSMLTEELKKKKITVYVCGDLEWVYRDPRQPVGHV